MNYPWRKNIRELNVPFEKSPAKFFEKPVMYTGIGKEILERNKAFNHHPVGMVSVLQLEPSREYIDFVDRLHKMAKDPSNPGINPQEFRARQDRQQPA